MPTITINNDNVKNCFLKLIKINKNKDSQLKEHTPSKPTFSDIQGFSDEQLWDLFGINSATAKNLKKSDKNSCTLKRLIELYEEKNTSSAHEVAEKLRLFDTGTCTAEELGLLNAIEKSCVNENTNESSQNTCIKNTVISALTTLNSQVSQKQLDKKFESVKYRYMTLFDCANFHNFQVFANILEYV